MSTPLLPEELTQQIASWVISEPSVGEGQKMRGAFFKSSKDSSTPITFQNDTIDPCVIAQRLNITHFTPSSLREIELYYRTVVALRSPFGIDVESTKKKQKIAQDSNNKDEKYDEDPHKKTFTVEVKNEKLVKACEAIDEFVSKTLAENSLNSKYAIGKQGKYGFEESKGKFRKFEPEELFRYNYLRNVLIYGYGQDDQNQQTEQNHPLLKINMNVLVPQEEQWMDETLAKFRKLSKGNSLRAIMDAMHENDPVLFGAFKKRYDKMTKVLLFQSVTVEKDPHTNQEYPVLNLKQLSYKWTKNMRYFNYRGVSAIPVIKVTGLFWAKMITTSFNAVSIIVFSPPQNRGITGISDVPNVRVKENSVDDDGEDEEEMDNDQNLIANSFKNEIPQLKNMIPVVVQQPQAIDSSPVTGHSDVKPLEDNLLDMNDELNCDVFNPENDIISK